jgi:hypothetical protein
MFPDVSVGPSLKNGSLNDLNYSPLARLLLWRAFFRKLRFFLPNSSSIDSLAIVWKSCYLREGLAKVSVLRARDVQRFVNPKWPGIRPLGKALIWRLQ